MDINKKNRTELKNFFKKNAIPTESNFADFIDAGINEKEDGLYKTVGSPLHVEATTSAGPKTALKLYETFTGDPSWAVSLYETAASQSAFVLSDTAGTTRLWIGASDGIVHVGSYSTPGALTAGSLAATGAVTAGSFTTTGGGTITSAGLLTASAGLTVTGGPLNVGTSGVPQPANVYGALTASSTIAATGLITATGGVTTSGNISTNTFTASGTLTANGGITTSSSSAISANGGLTVPSGKTLTVSGSLAAQGTTTTTLTSSGLITANAGLTVPVSQTLTVNGNLTASATTTTTLTASGLVSANAGLTVPVGQTLTANGPFTATGTTATGTTTTGTLTSSGLITANAGLTVPASQTLTVNGTLTAQGTTTTTLTSSGLITANGGVSVAGGNLTAGNLISANGGLQVTAGTLTAGSTGLGATTTSTLTSSGVITANGGVMVPSSQTLRVDGTLTANGSTGTAALTASGLITANAGLSVASGSTTTGALTSNGLITANAGLTVAGGTLTAGTTNTGALTSSGTLTANGALVANNGLTVSSTLTANNSVTVGGNLTVTNSFNTNGPVSMFGNSIAIRPPSRTALRLDKVLSQYATVATIPNTIPFDTGVTIQAYIFLYLLEDNARIIDFGSGAGSDNIMFYTFADGSLGAQVYRGTTAGTAFKSASGLLSVGHWIHVAMTVDNTGVFKIYKDAVLQSTSSASSGNVPLAVSRTSNFIGKSNASGPPFFSGCIADLTVWTGVRTISTVQPVGNETGMVAFWPGGTIGDYCTNSGHLGNTTWQAGARASWALTWDRGNSVDLTPEDWSAVALLNSWTNFSTSYNAPGFFKDPSGMVHLRGVFTPATTGTVAFTLPANYRPEKIERIPLAASVAGSWVEVSSGGNVTINLTGSPTWVSLDGVRFRQYQ